MTLAAKRLAGRRGHALLIAALAVGATWVSAPSALAAPEWSVKMAHANPYGQQASQCIPNHEVEPSATPPCGINPFTEATGDEGEGGRGETFARESGYNTYTITVKNAGSTSAGKVTVRDRLPAGMMLVAAHEREEAGGTGWEGGKEPRACKIVVSPAEAECTSSAPLEKEKSYPPITLHVFVTPQAANPSTNVATVTGGGGAEKSTTEEEGKTKITEAVPFGFDSFTTNIGSCEPEQSCAAPFKPFTQAGGHPFAVSTGLTLNFTTSAYPNAGGTEQLLEPVGGGAKELQVELPPGFVGNPLAPPQCPRAVINGPFCPLSVAVGYTSYTLESGLAAGIEQGRPRVMPQANLTTTSLVYNLEPPAGQPASFGFCFSKCLPLILDAKLRSGGDYGVTVGDTAVGERPLAADVTFCEHGVGGEPPNYHCEPAKPSSKPLLTNSTKCTGPPPLWSALANPWDEPAKYASKPVFVGAKLMGGAASEESFVTGCDKLPFHPKLEFKPSSPSEGGTSQAGEPTGMTLALNVPQNGLNEAGALATPAVKNVAMKLPAGMTLSPSAADGLQACTKAQFWPPENGAEPAEHREPAVPAQCPLASQIATVEVDTPLLSGTPTVSGGAVFDGHTEKVVKEGVPVTCSEGMWTGSRGSRELSYQFLRNGKKITTEEAKDATGNTFPGVYAVKQQDLGQAVQCQVTATNAAGSSVAVSRYAAGLFTCECSALPKAKNPPPLPEPPLPPSSIAAPSGTPEVPNTLECSPGAWTSSTSPTFTYQWLRGGQEIPGAAKPKYELVAADQGKIIQCQVTGTNASGSAIADSAAVVVAPEPSAPPPLPGAALQGQMFAGQPECSPCTNTDAEGGKLIRVFLQVRDPLGCPPSAPVQECPGITVKQVGKGTLNTATGQLTTTFSNAPQQPFELLQVRLKGGARAPLANQDKCGPAATEADLTPWSAPGLGGLAGSEPIPGTPDAFPPAEYEVTGCGLPQFSPSFNAGTTNNQAGAFSPLTLAFSRTDKDQKVQGLTVHTPPGLAGMLSNVALCPDQQANSETEECPAASQIGTTETGAGPGPHPFYLPGKVYLTGPYKGQPFGMSVKVPAVAGPFNLGVVVVRSTIHVDPSDATVTVTSDPFPKIRDGIPTDIRDVNVNVNRREFIFNPTNCSPQQISATLTPVQGPSAQVSSPFGIKGCASLPFHPTFTASTAGQASKFNGASLNVKVTSAGLGQAGIAKVNVQLPKALPSRLTTIQKACLASVFEANPATCNESSVIGTATIHTPVLKNPLSGPAFLVSHGNAAFPDVEFVLQGEGILLILDGKTDIKNGITYSKFESTPDAPFTSFETVLPTGPHSALTAFLPGEGNYNLCGTTLTMPTTITGQNGAVIKQETQIAVTGCPPTVGITRIRVAGSALLVTVNASAPGTVSISGDGLKTTKRSLTAGAHQVRVPFTKAGIKRHKHHKRTSVRVQLVAGGQSVAKTATVRL